MKSKILFILKKRVTSYGNSSSSSCVQDKGTPLKSSGLLNSARFVHEMLLRAGVDSHIVEVIDNNEIDREVTRVRPTHVIIEAVWVVPEKFDILTKLHPTVTWVVRIHSEIPFLSGEGIAFDWFFKYMKQPNVVVACNTRRTTEEFQMLYALTDTTLTQYDVESKIVYLPNFYPVGSHREPHRTHKKDVLDVGCFGAIRPFKNHVLQAVAAIDFATRIGKKLRFHVNSTRVEGGAESYRKNLLALFAGLNSDQYELVEHPWMDHTEFIELVRQMDICLQMSFTETFNIVTADAVNSGIPVVTSSEVRWVCPRFHASPTSSDDIVKKMRHALWWDRWVSPFIDVNRAGLVQYSRDARRIWLYYFG